LGAPKLRPPKEPDKEPRTVKGMWESFARTVLPKDCSGTQLIETRRAFYAGAGAMWVIMAEDIQKPAHITVLKKEIDRFYADEVKTGYGIPKRERG